jgi:hypothetical protein
MALLNVYRCGMQVNSFFRNFLTLAGRPLHPHRVGAKQSMVKQIAPETSSLPGRRRGRPSSTASSQRAWKTVRNLKSYLDCALAERRIGSNGVPSGSEQNRVPLRVADRPGPVEPCLFLGLSSSSSRRKKQRNNKIRRGAPTSSVSRPDLRTSSWSMQGLRSLSHPTTKY